MTAFEGKSKNKTKCSKFLDILQFTITQTELLSVILTYLTKLVNFWYPNIYVYLVSDTGKLYFLTLLRKKTDKNKWGGGRYCPCVHVCSLMCLTYTTLQYPGSCSNAIKSF